MELISWHPDLSRECGGQGLSLVLRLSVECSVCRQIYKLSTDRYGLEADLHCIAIRQGLDGKVEDAVTPSPCPGCGVVQTFSRHDRGRLQEEVEAIVTEEWVRAHCQKLAA
jgi:hypothetical protein